MDSKQKSWWYRSTENLSFTAALLWIFIPTVFIAGSGAIALSYYKFLKDKKTHDKHYNIVALVQTGPEKEQLKTVYLSELLDLSVDKPVNIYTFDTNKAKEKLLASPLIKEANIKKVLPGTIYVDYTIRKPVAFLKDYSNTALDEEGVMLPFKPFFSPKKLPTITIGKEGFDTTTGGSVWGRHLDTGNADLAFRLLKLTQELLSSPWTDIKGIDVSKAEAESFGQRQVVLSVEERFQVKGTSAKQTLICPVILRLYPKNIEPAVSRYIKVKNKILKKILVQAVTNKNQSTVKFSPIIVDLRLKDIALLSQ